MIWLDSWNIRMKPWPGMKATWYSYYEHTVSNRLDNTVIKQYYLNSSICLEVNYWASIVSDTAMQPNILMDKNQLTTNFTTESSKHPTRIHLIEKSQMVLMPDCLHWIYVSNRVNLKKWWFLILNCCHNRRHVRNITIYVGWWNKCLVFLISLSCTLFLSRLHLSNRSYSPAHLYESFTPFHDNYVLPRVCFEAFSDAW